MSRYLWKELSLRRLSAYHSDLIGACQALVFFFWEGGFGDGSPGPKNVKPPKNGAHPLPRCFSSSSFSSPAKRAAPAAQRGRPGPRGVLVTLWTRTCRARSCRTRRATRSCWRPSDARRRFFFFFLGGEKFAELGSPSGWFGLVWGFEDLDPCL